jgi:hypothetical protein
MPKADVNDGNEEKKLRLHETCRTQSEKGQGIKQIDTKGTNVVKKTKTFYNSFKQLISHSITV